MPDRSDNKNNQDEPEAFIEDRVDEMMDPTKPGTNKPIHKTVVSGVSTKSEIDIFGDTNPLASSAERKKNDSPEVIHPTQTKAEDDDTIAKGIDVTDETADPLVDDIVAKEGDELLAKQDEEVTKAFTDHKPSLKERVKEFFVTWWNNKPARYGTIAAVAVGITVAGIIPGSRYFMLNTAGVRAAASLTVLDSTTDLPLKNVEVSLGQHTGTTNQDGVVRLKGLKLGSQDLTIRQLGFARVTRTVTLGLGSNPLGEVELKAVGAQFTFKLTDYTSGKPVGSAEAASGDANAQSNDKGEVVLTIGNIDKPKLDVVLTAVGYRNEKVTIDTTSNEVTNVIMVTKRKEVFVSKQSGKYDVYKVDIDGKNRQLLLAGTGNERQDITLLPHPSEEVVALVSSRDTKRNQDGYLLQTLTLIDIEDGTPLTLEHSERIELIDWARDRLVYVKVKAGTSAGNAERMQMMSYDYKATTRLQLAAANNFPNIISAKGALYYMTANYYSGNTQPQFFKVNPDSTGKQSLLTAPLWNVHRVSYDEFRLSGPSSWYSYRIGDTAARKLPQAPANASEARFYLDASDGKRTLWTDNRDGKGVLLMQDTATKKDTVITSRSGLTGPVRWIDSRTAIFRVVTSTETASYVVDITSGNAKKITDVTNTSGPSSGYLGY